MWSRWHTGNRDGLALCRGGPGAGQGLHSDCGGGAGGADERVGPGDVRVAQDGESAAAIPGAAGAGDAVSGGGGAGGGTDAVGRTGGPLPPGGRRDGGGAAGGGPVAEGGAGLPYDAGDDHGRRRGEPGGGILPGAEARRDCGVAGVVAERRAEDRGRVAARRCPDGGDGGDAGEGELRGP